MKLSRYKTIASQWNSYTKILKTKRQALSDLLQNIGNILKN